MPCKGELTCRVVHRYVNQRSVRHNHYHNVVTYKGARILLYANRAALDDMKERTFQKRRLVIRMSLRVAMAREMHRYM